MKNLKITLSSATLFIASHAVQGTEIQEQNTPTNEQAIYQLELQSIYQPELQYQPEIIGVSPFCADLPNCANDISNLNQPLETQPTPTQE